MLRNSWIGWLTSVASTPASFCASSTFSIVIGQRPCQNGFCCCSGVWTCVWKSMIMRDPAGWSKEIASRRRRGSRGGRKLFERLACGFHRKQRAGNAADNGKNGEHAVDAADAVDRQDQSDEEGAVHRRQPLRDAGCAVADGAQMIGIILGRVHAERAWDHAHGAEGQRRQNRKPERAQGRRKGGDEQRHGSKEEAAGEC